MSNVLVLGGTSWVGGQIARDAAARGHDVTCLARWESGDAPVGVMFVRADRSDPAAYDEVRGQREAKVACEQLVGALPHTLITRVGLTKEVE